MPDELLNVSLDAARGLPPERWLRLLESFVLHASEAIVITEAGSIDPPGPRIVFVNEAFTAMTGYSAAEALGNTPRMLQGPATERLVLDQIRRDLEAGKPSRAELINYRKDGSEFWSAIHIVPLISDSGAVTHWAATKRDVTEQRHLEERLRQPSKMEAVGRLAGGVAHDFNNSLTVIGGYAQMLLEAFPPGSPHRADIEEIALASERSAAVTERLLAFSRPQVMPARILDINSIAAGMNKLLQRIVGGGVELVTVLRPDLNRIRAEPGQIEQVLMNLVVNALDATPPGGKIAIETGNVELGDEYTRSRPGLAPGMYVMLSVADTGRGMDASTKAHLFEPFFTTKAAGKGTGLGLATVYAVVKHCGGDIDVFSEPGAGTTIRIYFPAVFGAREPEPAPVVVRRPLKGSETVLLVEDEAGVRKLMRELLSRQGYKVIEARDGLDALRVGAGHRGHIDLLLTDLAMPRIGGGELARQMRGDRPDLKVLYVSGCPEPEILETAPLSPASALLQKPFSSDVLLGKLRDLLDLADPLPEAPSKPSDR